MAEYGLIKDTTLKAIADSLRDKGIIDEFRTETVGQIEVLNYKSENATSLTDPTPVAEQVPNSFNITIPEAEKLDLEIDIGVYENPATSASYIYNVISNVSVKKTSGSTLTDIGITRTSNKHLSIRAAANDISIAVTDAGSMQKDWAAFTVKVYPVVNDERVIVNREATVINSITPEAMAEAVNNFDMPAAPPESAFSLTGDISYKFRFGDFDWFLEMYSNKLTTTNVISMRYTFNKSTVTKLPFTINVQNLGVLYETFSDMHNLAECPKIRGTLDISTNLDMQSCFTNCRRVRYLDDLLDPEMLNGVEQFKITSSYSCMKPPRFTSCMSLRRVPAWWYKFKLSPESTSLPASSYSPHTGAFNSCYSLDEVRDMFAWECKATTGWTTNVLSNIVTNASRLASFTFETNEDGSPKTSKWSNQTIDFTSYVGYAAYKTYIVDHNSGITADKEVKDDATYQALKNDPDWFTLNIAYSRYNHDSAVETINSLPDTSTYGTNTIKFKKGSGSKTDGGDISNLTPEEIAVATAKGWTVTLS